MLKTLLFFLGFLLVQNSFSQSYYIRGRVTDDENQSPLKGASVYINNTTKGSVTDDNGEYELGPFESGRYEVVASFVGYAPLLFTAELMATGKRLSFKLVKKEETIREVLVLSSETRKRYLEIFKKHVLGQSLAADRCRIKNMEEIQFATGETRDEILAYTEKELEIENPELGYTIYFELLNFYYNKESSATYFYGYTRFVDWGTDELTKKKWIRKRKQAYEGSSVHFFRSLVNSRMGKEGFTVYQLMDIQKGKKETARIQNAAQRTVSGMQREFKTVEDSMIRIYPDSVYHIYELRLHDGWRIIYSRNTDLKTEITGKIKFIGQPVSGTISGLRLREGSVLISDKGIVLTPTRLFYDGIWGYELLANMLPEDYEAG